MKAIIVAGGKGERLHPITENIPKPMIEINGKPILHHVIELLKSHGITEIILALCYLPDAITAYFGNGKKLGVEIEYMYENPFFPRGTAGAIYAAKSLIDNTFIVTYADILRELDVEDMIRFHKKNSSFATLNVYKRKSKNAKSKVLIDRRNLIKKLIERPQGNELRGGYIWANGSFYIFEQEIFNWIPEHEKTDFGSDIFPKLLAFKKALYAYPTNDYFVDIGDIKKLEFTRKTFKINPSL